MFYKKEETITTLQNHTIIGSTCTLFFLLCTVSCFEWLTTGHLHYISSFQLHCYLNFASKLKLKNKTVMQL